MAEFTAPTFNSVSFNCPHCGAFSSQSWCHQKALQFNYPHGPAVIINIQEFDISRCYTCGNVAYWFNKRMVFPVASAAPFASPDMSPEVAKIYNEARDVLPISPRSSAALLRLAIQILCKELNQPGENIFDDIGTLVKHGCDVRVQKALDVIRHVGNEQVHPGTIDLEEEPDRALLLFKLLHMVVHDMITRPAELNEEYDNMPETVRKAIERRNARALASS